MAFFLQSEKLAVLKGQQRHQARLILIVLTLIAVYFGIIGTINVVVFASMDLALMDYAGMVLVLGVLHYFRRSANLQVTAWVVIILLSSILLLFIHLAGGMAYSIIWVTILPPLAFFLLGRTGGTWVCGLVFTYVIIYFYLNMNAMPALAPTTGSLLNITEVLIAHWLLFRLYERSRGEAYDELDRLSKTDKLTGLFNRSHLDTLLFAEFDRHQAVQNPLTLVLCDIDHFKRINDKHGHLSGDAVLQQVAETLQQCMRSSDLCGRWGGEEFLLICPDTPVEAAAAIVQKLQQALLDTKFIDDVNVTLSFGIASLQDCDTTAEQPLRRADDALYEAKRRGRNCFVIDGAAAETC